jgi:hypothetical protein
MTQGQTSKDYAWQLYATAVEFNETYRAIMADQSGRHRFEGMKPYTLCHALELVLKSLLVDTGNYNEYMLKDKKLCHNLAALANEVKQVYGTFPEVDACMGFINILNPDYFKKGYEYPINNGRFTGIKEYTQVADIVLSLIHTCARSIQSNKYPDKSLPPPAKKSKGTQLI